jgi:pimeloyl-ACP methyl ester carboxylesterase
LFAAPLVAASVLAGFAVPARAAGSPGGCRDIRVEIPVAGSDPESYSLAGEMCLPSGGRTPVTALLALHGLTYNHTYWDPGFEPDRYSFSRAMTAAGYAVLAIDRLGDGASSHPPSTAATLPVQAALTHSLIGMLHSGQVNGERFPAVALVGHSYGTDVVMRESATWNDAAAVIGTGWSSTPQPATLTTAAAAMEPAGLDPMFAGRHLDPGYLTTRPGARGQDGLLYSVADADPAMIAYDEDFLRDTTASGEETSYYQRSGSIPLARPDADNLAIPLSDHTDRITIPVLILDGAQDALFCGPDLVDCRTGKTLRAHEQPFFPHAACLQGAVTPHSGHDLNLHRNAPDTYTTIRAWLDRSVGPDGAEEGRPACSGGTRPGAVVRVAEEGADEFAVVLVAFEDLVLDAGA